MPAAAATGYGGSVGAAEQGLEVGEGIEAALVLLALGKLALGMLGAFEIRLR